MGRDAFEGLDVVVRFGGDLWVAALRAAVKGAQIPGAFVVQPHHEPFALDIVGATLKGDGGWQLSARSRLDASHGRVAHRFEDELFIHAHPRLEDGRVVFDDFRLDEASATLLRLRGVRGNTYDMGEQVDAWLGSWSLMLPATALALEMVDDGIGAAVPGRSRVVSRAPRADAGASLAVGTSALRRWLSGSGKTWGGGTIRVSATSEGVRVTGSGKTADVRWGDAGEAPLHVVGDGAWTDALRAWVSDAMAAAGWDVSRGSWRVPVATTAVDALHDETWDVVTRLGAPHVSAEGVWWSLEPRIGRRRAPHPVTLTGWESAGETVASVQLTSERGQVTLDRATAVRARDAGKLGVLEIPETLADGTPVPISVRQDLAALS